MINVDRKILLNPGPATTTDSVKMAMVVPDICPREKDFVEVMQEVRQGLLRAVRAGNDYTCVLFGGSGTAAMDAVINSVVPPKKKILVINNGAYGERMIKIANGYNIDCAELVFPWNDLPDLNTIERTLDDDMDITHIAVVHHETTSGLLNPLKELEEIARSSGKTLVVDAISSFAGIPIDMSEDGIDYLMSTANKCVEAMVGVSFVICKKEEIEELANWPPRSFYLDLYSQYRYMEETGEMRFTPPVQVIYALRQAVRELLEEGLEKRFERYKENWSVLTIGLKKMGFQLFLEDEKQSGILTSVVEPDHPNYDFMTMHDLLYEKGFTIYPGKIGTANTFRVANLGAINAEDIRRFLQALKTTLDQMNVVLAD